MKLKEIINGTSKLEEPIFLIFKELYEDNLAIDLAKEDLEPVLNQEVTSEMIEKVKTLTKTKHDEWNYFDVMNILGF